MTVVKNFYFVHNHSINFKVYMYFRDAGKPGTLRNGTERNGTGSIGACRAVWQWRSQVIGIGRAPAVRLTIALTTLALART